MPNKLNSVPRSEAKLPRTGFDVGRDYTFTSAPGMILPLYYDVLNQGEKISFNAAIKTIFRPVYRPAACDVRQKVDLFFIPLQMMWTPFGNMFYQTTDYLSSSISEYNRNLVNRGETPVLNFGELFYEYFSDLAQLNSRAYSGRGAFFDSDLKGAFRLLMHLGYNPCVSAYGFEADNVLDFTDSSFSTWQPNVMPLFALAYQAIYQNYYRDDDREPRVLDSYQFDAYDGNVQLPDLLGIFMLRYHQKEKDYFTSLHVSPIMSTLNLPKGDASASDVLSAVNNYLSSETVLPTESTVVPYPANVGDNGKSMTQVSYVNNGSFPVSTGSLRSMLAVEKLLRITGRARKNYDSQTLAHLGFKVPRDIKHEITFIGSIDGNLGVNQVLSTGEAADPTSTENSGTLGERGGFGGGNLKSKDLQFTAPCHGVLMAVTYTVPSMSYPQGYVVDKLTNITDRMSFYIPEFRNLGQQPMYVYEALGAQDARNMVKPIGWQYRDAEKKQKYNVHSLAFFNPYSDSSGHRNSWSPWLVGGIPFVRWNIDQYDNYTPHFESFMVYPGLMDNIFIQHYNPDIADINDLKRPWLLFQTDPFMHAARINCKKVSTMSTFGEPELY